MARCLLGFVSKPSRVSLMKPPASFTQIPPKLVSFPVSDSCETRRPGETARAGWTFNTDHCPPLETSPKHLLKVHTWCLLATWKPDRTLELVWLLKHPSSSRQQRQDVLAVSPLGCPPPAVSTRLCHEQLSERLLCLPARADLCLLFLISIHLSVYR